MSQNLSLFAAAKIRLFQLLTIFFREFFSNILYLFDNQLKIEGVSRCAGMECPSCCDFAAASKASTK